MGNRSDFCQTFNTECVVFIISIASCAQRYYYDLYHCHIEAAAPKKEERRLLYLDFKREIASVAKFPA